MTRGIGGVSPLQELLPEWAAVLVSLWTQLGDVWFLAVLVGLLYWFSSNRDDVAVLIGVSIAGVALGSLLKSVFALPRPAQPLVRADTLPGIVEPLYETTAVASGHGFPSIHALLATIVYIGLAHHLSISTLRRRYVGAMLIIVTVSLTRVALGVHYLVDVIAGFSLGLAFVGVMGWILPRWPSDRPTVAAAIAVVLSALDIAVGGVDADGLVLLGTALGLFGAWQLVLLGPRLRAHDRPSNAVRPLVHRGLPAVGALAPLGFAVDEFALLSLPSIAGAVGLMLAVFVTVPVVRESRLAQKVWEGIRFWISKVLLGIRRLLSTDT